MALARLSTGTVALLESSLLMRYREKISTVSPVRYMSALGSCVLRRVTHLPTREDGPSRFSIDNRQITWYHTPCGVLGAVWPY
jgi:hypothetical protein